LEATYHDKAGPSITLTNAEGDNLVASLSVDNLQKEANRRESNQYRKITALISRPSQSDYARIAKQVLEWSFRFDGADKPFEFLEQVEGKWRLCAVFRQINAKSIKDAYPMPRKNYIIDQLREARYISSLDLKDEYWQTTLKADSRQYTALTVPGKGLFQWRVMPFGLHSASATFQRVLARSRRSV